jgi:hypothetical protein
VVHQKTTGFLGWSKKPRPKNRRRRCSSSKPVWPVRSTSLTGVRRRSLEISKWRTRVGIARLATRLSRLRSPGIRPMERWQRFPISSSRGMYP